MVLKFLRKVSRTYSTVDGLARRATNKELFGPTTDELQQLTRLTFKPKAFTKIMGVLEYRLHQNDRHWRQKSKTLTILQYFVIHGSPQCLEWMQMHKTFLEGLCKYHYIDSRNNDQGRSVREKAEALLQVISDPNKVESAKLAYRKQREGLRKSIGTGRPSTQSRNTLEMLRDSILDDSDPVDINGAFKSALSPNAAPVEPIESEGRTFRGLSAIEEEH